MVESRVINMEVTMLDNIEGLGGGYILPPIILYPITDSSKVLVICPPFSSSLLKTEDGNT